jgi:general secretion pathway protein G
MVILGLLAAFVGQNYFKHIDEAYVKSTKMQLTELEAALDSFRLDLQRYPSTSEGLQALVADPGADGWSGPYLKKPVIPPDAWHRPFIYESPGTHGEYDLYSYGADGAAGGEGKNKDITSWE